MSIDLEIIPTSPEHFYWGELREKFWELLTIEDRQRLGKVSLCKLGSDEIVLENEKIFLLDNQDHSYYYLLSDLPTNLGMNIRKNEPNYISEVDMVEDFGCNLDTATVQNLIQKWKAIGYVYGVDLVLRKKYQPPLFVALATAIAYLCKGYVINMSDRFTLDVGIYAPNISQQTKITK